MNYKTVFSIFLAIWMIPAGHVAHADIYKHVDKEGVLHLTNVPSDPSVKYVMVMREKRILFRPNLDVKKYDYLISKAADKFNLDSALIKAIIKAESNFNHRAVSPVGAQGLMQLMPICPWHSRLTMPEKRLWLNIITAFLPTAKRKIMSDAC